MEFMKIDKKKLENFWYYYKYYVIAGAFVLFLILVFIRDKAKSKDYAFFTSFVNCNVLADTEVFMQAYEDTTSIDKEKEMMYLDTTNITDGYDQTSLASMERFVSMVYVGEIDSAIMERDLFTKYGTNGVFMDLRDIFSKEELSSFEGHLYYLDYALLSTDEEETEVYSGDITDDTPDTVNHHDPSGMENPVPVGIYLEDGLADKVIAANLYSEDSEIIYGILSTKRMPYPKDFLYYLTK